MDVKLVGTIIYTAKIDDEIYRKEDFDLQSWAEKEFLKQSEAFLPDECCFKECLVSDEDANA